MTIGTIPSSAIPDPITSPTAQQNFVDQNNRLTGPSRLALQQLYSYVVSMCRTFPCNASTSSNVITLKLLSVQPTVTQYADYDTFAFVADAGTTAAVTAKVVTSSATLATLPVYKNNGSATAGNADISKGNQYTLTYVDSLNTTGGFVLR